jgi:peroxiredoxin
LFSSCEKNKSMLAEGTGAPDFQLGNWRLSEALRRGPVLLAFFKISCPTCQLTFPFLQRLADQAGLGTPQLAAVSQDDSKGTAQFQQRFGPSGPALLDEAPAYRASNLYQVRNVPTLYLIESDSTISMAVAGFSKAALETLGERFGVTPFREGEQVPVLRPG